MKSKKELFCYLFCGGVTTAVNYLLYGGLLFLRLPYIAANSIAWVGAVLTAYVLNRRLVFHSRNKIWKELPSFAALRFLTLLVENVLLWLLIDHLYILPLPAKLLVSVITVVGNYVFCKYGVFKKEEICHG
ncbi:MAG: GtrA family protein [Mediterraneibacter sp.]